jgi:adenylylsulfate kinase-like enzyme
MVGHGTEGEIGLANRGQDDERTRVLVITGPVGVGKTSTAIAIGEELKRAGEAFAVIDVDWLRWAGPAPLDDRFNSRLGHRNLAAVAANFRVAGARWMICADVIETEADRAAYQASIPNATLTIVRLHAPIEELHRRLEGRERGDDLIWHKGRAIELSALMDDRAVEDLLIDTDGRSIEAVAHDILASVRAARQSPF